MKKTLLLLASLLVSFSSFSQSGFFEPRELQRAYENGSRSRDGAPVEDYWQNSANYDLQVRLNPESKILKGEGQITYMNNSPDSLRYLVVKLLPNIQKEGSAKDYAADPESLNEGMVIDSIAINNKSWDLSNRREAFFYGTNLYLIFSRTEKLPPGASTNIYVNWSYEVVKHGIRNGAHSDSSFFIGYWYPQIAVYDDVFGWDREDYTGKQETYNDTGTYHVEISLPEDYIVWSTGNQLNEKDVFSGKILDRINASRESSETLKIITENDYELGNLFKDDHQGTWIYEAKGVPDFAWACSNYYLWDANNLASNENKHEVWVNAVYPPDSKTFDKVADVAHESIQYLSEVFPGVPYPFNKHITYNGINYIGVEYPMIANNGDHESEEMYTELKHAWIDEGWVKLTGELYGESMGLKREEKSVLNTIDVYERTAGTSNDLPLIVPSGFMTVGHNFYHSYAKAANSNMFLLDLMKEKGVDEPLKEFLNTWAGKHPTPYDFFYLMNSLCGEDLSWFWNPWYFNFSSPDLGIIKSEEEDQITIVNKGGIPLPVVLQIEYEDGTHAEIEKSIWCWSDEERNISVKIPEFNKVQKITLGNPNIPDIDYNNNTLVL